MNILCRILGLGIALIVCPIVAYPGHQYVEIYEHKAAELALWVGLKTNSERVSDALWLCLAGPLYRPKVSVTVAFIVAAAGYIGYKNCIKREDTDNDAQKMDQKEQDVR